MINNTAGPLCFIVLDSSGHLYGILLRLVLPYSSAVNCAVLQKVKKVITFRNVAFQTANPG